MLRITGLVSGMDTDTTVKKLIEIEQIKVDKAEQEKQYLQWQKEDYREMANTLRGFQDTYFDVLNTKTYMMSENTFNMFAGSASIGGVATSAISIRTSATSIAGNISIDSISQLATKEKVESGSEVMGNIISSDISAFDGTSSAAYAANKQLSFTLDGVTKTITLDDNLTTHTDIAENISEKLQDAFESVDVFVNSDSGKLDFRIYKNDTTDLNAVLPDTPETGGVSEAGHTFTVGSTNSDLLTELGLETGQSTSVDVSKSIEEVFDINTTSSITINGTAFSFDSTASINDVINEINASDVGVTMSYDLFNDKFEIEANVEGTNYGVDITGDSGLFTKMKLAGGDESKTDATNSVFTVNGVETSRADNTFEINGTEITLQSTSAEAIDIAVSSDTTDVKDMIIKFVGAYNEMIGSINDKLSERPNYDYKPLSDEQKKAMTDDDIEAWEVQARKGTLRSDPVLDKLTSSLRRAFYESTEGLGISLHEIGIQSSVNYLEQGKLVIDEEKLEAALNERPNEVIQLFTQSSDTSYTDFSNKSTRYNESGISDRISDILKDHIRITRDDNDRKGYLIEKAGLETGVDATSDMAKKIQAMDDKIADLLEMLGEKEDNYYQEFARMESMMSSYSSQSEWLASQFGG